MRIRLILCCDFEQNAKRCRQMFRMFVFYYRIFLLSYELQDYWGVYVPVYGFLLITIPIPISRTMIPLIMSTKEVWFCAKLGVTALCEEVSE